MTYYGNLNQWSDKPGKARRKKMYFQNGVRKFRMKIGSTDCLKYKYITTQRDSDAVRKGYFSDICFHIKELNERKRMWKKSFSFFFFRKWILFHSHHGIDMAFNFFLFFFHSFCEFLTEMQFFSCFAHNELVFLFF